MVDLFTWAILSLTTIALLLAIYFNVMEHIRRRNRYRTVNKKIESYLKIFNYAVIIAIIAFCLLAGIFERPNPWLIPVFLILILFAGVNGFKFIWDLSSGGDSGLDR
jgi:Na+/melibiose symporter-like transporter